MSGTVPNDDIAYWNARLVALDALRAQLLATGNYDYAALRDISSQAANAAQMIRMLSGPSSQYRTEEPT